jgi:hypothetical protein
LIWLDGNRPLTPAQRRALLAIVRCRTPTLGGHLYRCADCDETDFAYHSCHHRACPRCGAARTAAWTARQTDRLLPVPYFLVTFTVPEPLRPIFAAQPALLHDLFFTEAARALQTVAARPRHLGAELGMVGVFHNWGRQVQLHPHLHFIIPGGGLTADRKQWRPARAARWLLPKAAVEAALRQGMAAALRAAAPELHAQVPEACWREGWWIHCRPAGSGENVVKYLARYVTRTAISDERIVATSDESVTFRYTDSDSQQAKECTLAADEFMRRYLQHVPPPGQHRVRYFGWMHPSAKRRRLIVETLLAVVIVVRARPDEPLWHRHCPHCGAFALRAGLRRQNPTRPRPAGLPPMNAPFSHHLPSSSNRFHRRRPGETHPLS